MELKVPVYIYDGECVLCSRAVRYVITHDRSEPCIHFIAIKSKLGRTLATQHKVDPDDPHTFIFIEEGQAYILSDAVFALARRAGGPGQYIRMFRAVPKAIRDWFYARLANNRYTLFGKLSSCYLPADKVRHRFVLETDTDIDHILA